MPASAAPIFPAQQKILAELGERLRLARLRRAISVAAACERAAISRMTLYRAERGDAAVTMSVYLRLLSVLGLQGDLALLAADDRVGRLIQDSQLKARRSRSPLTRAAKPSESA